MIRQLNTGIFPYTIHTFQGSTKKAKEYFIELTGDQERVDEYVTGRYGATTIDTNTLNILIHFPKNPSIYVVVHELFHAVEFTLGKAGVRYCDESSETYAYLLEHLVKQWIQK